MESEKILKLLEIKQKELTRLLSEVNKTNTSQVQLLKRIDGSLDQISANYSSNTDLDTITKENEDLKVKIAEISKIINAPFAISGLSPVDVLRIRKLVS